MTHARVGADQFPLPRQCLRQMLGERPEQVSRATDALETAGAINYARDVVTVLDRAGLERSTCACYHVVRDELDRLLEGA